MFQELTLTRRGSVTNGQNGQERQVRVVHEIACGRNCGFKTKNPQALLSHRCNNVAPKPKGRRNIRKTQQRI